MRYELSLIRFDTTLFECRYVSAVHHCPVSLRAQSFLHNTHLYFVFQVNEKELDINIGSKTVHLRASDKAEARAWMSNITQWMLHSA